MAIKLISLERFYQKYVEREILNHRQLTHPHIVAFKEIFVTSKVSQLIYFEIVENVNTTDGIYFGCSIWRSLWNMLVGAISKHGLSDIIACQSGKLVASFNKSFLHYTISINH